jgi:hypothetical protein
MESRQTWIWRSPLKEKKVKMIKSKKRNEKGILVTPAIIFAVLSLLIVLSPTAAAATTISVQDVTVLPGGSATIPIMITDVTDVGVAAIEFSYNPSVVHVTAVTDSQFDVCDPTIDNVTGEFEIAGVQFWSPGLNGNARLANVTLKAVGTSGQSSPLSITINELKTVGPPSQNIPADVDDGTFTIQADTTAPIVKNPSAVPMIIPEDTDNNPLWGELANLTAEATDESGIANVTVTVNLSLVGKEEKVMNLIGNYTNGILWGIFNYSTNASIGTAGWNGAVYVPYQLELNATDIYGNSNISVSIELTVMRNGDVNVDGVVTYSDAMYLYKWKAGKPGFDTIYEAVADVDGDSSVTYSDAMYLYKWKAGKPGFDVLH